jgi:hypothetical protein
MKSIFGGLLEALLNFNPLRPIPQTDRIFNDDAGRILRLEYGSKWRAVLVANARIS